MQIIRSKSELKAACLSSKADKKTIGFVPTMGALHKGHLSLVDIAKQNADLVIASIFVNPAQFAAHEDLDTYPRNETQDLELLKDKAVDIAYLPKVEDIYPEGFDFSLSTGALGQDLEGQARPHFFDGVALVVSKLLLQTYADVAVFGEKDFQQLTIIKRLVEQFDIPTKIIGGATIREADGLAFSSRNIYLNQTERQIAGKLNVAMRDVMQKLSADNVTEILDNAKQELRELGFSHVDYLELRDNNTLAKVNALENDKDYRLLAAVVLGETRLIDNMLYSKQDE